MSISQTQTSGTKHAAGSGTLSHSFASLPAVGSVIIVPFSCFTNSGTVSVADNQSGNTWAAAKVSDSIGGSFNIAGIWWTQVVGSTGTFTVTATSTGGSGSYWSGGFSEWSFGSNVTVSVDVTAKNTSGSGAIDTGTTGTTAQNEELAIAVCCNNLFGAATLTSSPSNTDGYNGTALFSETDGSNYEVGDARYKILSSTGAQVGNWVWGVSGSNTACIAVFKAIANASANTKRSYGFCIG